MLLNQYQDQLADLSIAFCSSYMTERTKVSRHSCFGDDDGDNDTFDMQNTHGQSRFTLPATLPVTRNFSHYPTRTLLEVKKPYSSVSAVV